MTSIQIDRTDGLSSSTAIKGPVRVATTANITLSGEQTIDGVAVVTDDRVLVKDQTNAVDNGIWKVSTGVWSRAKDFSGNRDVKTGTMINVVGGTVGAGWWQVTTTDPIVIGTTSIAFGQTLQPYDADLASWATVTRATGFDAWVASPTAANLRALMVGAVTGVGALVFADSPTLVAPDLGTPSAAVLTNATGLPVATGISGLGAGVATFLGTPSSANLRAAVTDETGTGALVFANTPTLVTPVLGDATASSISMSGGSGVSHTFTGSGGAANIWVNQSSAALSNTVPEIGAQFTMTSNTGFANQTTAYKIAATFSVIGTSASASIYGTNTIVQGTAGAGGYLVTGSEVDINNVGAAAATLGAGTAAYGYIAVAAGSFNSTAAYSATGSGRDWTYGFATWLNGGKSVAHSDFRAESTATNILTATGARTNGIDISGATTSGSAFKSTGFNVDSAGRLTSPSITFTSAVATPGPSVFLTSNVLTFAGGTSGYAWDNNAVGAQLMTLSDTGQLTLSPVTTFASATAATWDDFKISSQTTTITGNTGSPITRLAKATINRPTLTDSSAVTVTDAASLYIENAPAAAGSVTLTNAWALQIGAGNVKLGGGLTIVGDILPAADVSQNIGSASFRIGTVSSFVVNATSAYQFSGTKVVGARDTGWTAMTGTPEKGARDTATVTLAQLAGQVMALKTALTTHGLIGT